MTKGRILLATGMIASLAVVILLAMAANTTGLLVPPVGMQLDPNWKPHAVSEKAFRSDLQNIKVNTDTGAEAQNEPFIAANPRNPAHLVVGANDWSKGNGSLQVMTYASFDAGKTWQASLPAQGTGQLPNSADPGIAFDSAGNVYVVYTSYGGNKHVIAINRSTDGGRTWGAQIVVSEAASEADKPALAVAGDRIYVFWNDLQRGLLARALWNGGAKMGTINPVARYGNFPTTAVDGSGAVSVFYTTQGGARLDVSRLSDDGNGKLSFRSNSVADVSPMATRPTRYRAYIIPSAAADEKGNLYVTWADGRNKSKGNDVFLASSLDGGLTWSKPVRVNDDAGAADQLMPALAVSGDGTVTISWLDNRDDAANYNYNIYMARLTTGDKPGANSRVSSVSSNPDNDPRIKGQMIGDYFAVAAAGNKVYPVWTDTRNYNQDIYLAPVDTSRMR